LTSNSDENHSIFVGRKFHFFQNILSYLKQDKTILSLYKKEILKQFKLSLLNEKPDALHFHNIHSANWPIDIVYEGLNYCNVVWTLHDCWSFTTSYYEGYQAPFFEEDEARKNRFWESLYKKKFNLIGVTPSAWMKKTAQNSSWSKHRIEIIHNPIPKKFFKATQRESIKKALGLHEQLPIVLCCAANLNEERKGARFLDAILNHKILEKFQLVLLGDCKLPAASQHENVHNLGFIKDDITLRMFYSAADMLVHLAPIDNLPNTIAESLAAGTPVLAFKTGGIPEMVQAGKSGWLVEEINDRSLLVKLEEIINENSFLPLRDSTQSHAKKLFDEELIANQYYKLFKAF
jgi:glycosyltransferase involved in cell wall biosynthesis